MPDARLRRTSTGHHSRKTKHGMACRCLTVLYFPFSLSTPSGSQHTLVADPRSAVLAEHGRPSRLRTTAVFHASRTPTRTLAHTLLTIERTCPAGASWSLPLGRLMHSDATHPSTRAGFSNASPFAISNFVRALVQHLGQLPPGPLGREGAYQGC